MARSSHSFLLIAAACAIMALAPQASALIEGPGVYYGLELPEPFYNYWNYTTDIKEMKALYERNNFAEAARIFVFGKNNARNSTTLRNMHEFTYRDLSIEGPLSFWGVYTKHFNSLQYLKDMIDPVLYGNGTYSKACCGVRAAALDVYLRLWQVAYAQHEVDVGVALNAAEEASHGFAVVSSPVDMAVNYWERVESYSSQACIAKVQDTLTPEMYAPANIAYRTGFADMGPAIDLEDVDQRTAEVATIRAQLERAIMVQFMQVMMVEAKRTAQKLPVRPANKCYKMCLKSAYQSGAKAAWTAIQPLVARSADKSAITTINNMLNSRPSSWHKKTFMPAFVAQVEKLAASFGVDFKREIYGCGI